MSNRFKTDDNPSNICLTSADIQKECTVGFGLYPVYGLEEDGSLLQEGGVRIPIWALRARSYKTGAEA